MWERVSLVSEGSTTGADAAEEFKQITCHYEKQQITQFTSSLLDAGPGQGFNSIIRWLKLREGRSDRDSDIGVS